MDLKPCCVEEANFYKIENLPVNTKPIILEVTPPCDFSQNKKMGRSRIIGGFICEYSKAAHNYNKDNYYKELYPLKLKGVEKPQMIIFDFRYFGSITETEIKDVKKYTLLFRTKDKLFADILQKLSSYIARLGLSIIQFIASQL